MDDTSRSLGCLAPEIENEERSLMLSVPSSSCLLAAPGDDGTEKVSLLYLPPPSHIGPRGPLMDDLWITVSPTKANQVKMGPSKKRKGNKKEREKKTQQQAMMTS